jgi:hypothetical protein
VNVFRRDRILAQLVFGQGIASYMNDGGMDLAPDGTLLDAHAQAVPLKGALIYFDHFGATAGRLRSATASRRCATRRCRRQPRITAGNTHPSTCSTRRRRTFLSASKRSGASAPTRTAARLTTRASSSRSNTASPANSSCRRVAFIEERAVNQFRHSGIRSAYRRARSALPLQRRARSNNPPRRIRHPAANGWFQGWKQTKHADSMTATLRAIKRHALRGIITPRLASEIRHGHQRVPGPA